MTYQNVQSVTARRYILEKTGPYRVGGVVLIRGMKSERIRTSDFYDY